MTVRAGRPVAWLAGLLAAGALLRLAATGDLASPPIDSLEGLAAWADARSPVASAVALVRLGAELCVWYCLALSALHVLATLLRARGGHRLADALAVPGVRRLVRAGLGVGLVASSVPGAGADVSPMGTATMAPVVDAGAPPQRPAEPPGTATMRPVATAAAVATATPPAAPVPSTWTVAAGESFWSIAEELLTDAWGRPPTDGEVDPVWRALVEANRGRLVDPDDPGLIQPGQVFEVPPVPSPAA